MSIASRKGLVAAAGPDQITIATSETVRKAFEGEGDEIRDYTPQLKIPMSMRISQLAFTADENYLILSAESGGGLAVYEVQSLLSGSTNSAFELSTNSESLRALAPNPTAEKAELCAIVTTNGNLHMANLKEKQISNSLKDQVSCVGWSTKGKQLCAGLADGTIHQMTPEGEAKAQIPKPSSVGNHHGEFDGLQPTNVLLTACSFIPGLAGEPSVAGHLHRIKRLSSVLRLQHHHQATTLFIYLPEDWGPGTALCTRQDPSPFLVEVTGFPA